MADPFAPVCIHGVWPLVRDESCVGGIRFADLDADAPEGCITSADDLPGAGIELRLFASPVARDAWCDAVSEFGGNAVSASPLREDAIPAALLVRFDRDRLPGDTPDACVALVGKTEADPELARKILRRQGADRARESKWQAAWATELAALNTVEDLRHDDFNKPKGLDKIVFETRGSRLAVAVWVTPSPKGRLVRLRMGRRDPFGFADADLGAAYRGAIERMGYTIDAQGDPAREVATLDGKALSSVMDDLASMESKGKVLQETMMRRSAISTALKERAGAILRKLVDGFPLAYAPASSNHMHQLNPFSGHGVDLDNYVVMQLWRAGAIRPAWWGARTGPVSKEKPFDAFEASVWVSTDLGADLIHGRVGIPEAADLLPAVRKSVWETLSGTSPSPGFETLRDIAPAEAWAPRPDGPVPAFARKAGALRLPKRAKDLVQLATWLVHGLDPDAPGQAPGGPRP